MAGIRDMAAANRDLDEVYRPRFNAQFAVPSREEGSAFVAWIGGHLDNILCEQFERTGGMTIVCASRIFTCRFPPTGIAATPSKPR
jgi:hypothetical protein